MRYYREREGMRQWGGLVIGTLFGGLLMLAAVIVQERLERGRHRG